MAVILNAKRVAGREKLQGFDYIAEQAAGMICSILMTSKCADLNTFEHELKVLRCLGMHLYVV